MINKENLRRLLDDPDYRPARIFAVSIQVLVVVSLVAYSLTTLPDLAPETRASLYFLEAITIAIFAVACVAVAYTSRAAQIEAGEITGFSAFIATLVDEMGIANGIVIRA